MFRIFTLQSFLCVQNTFLYSFFRVCELEYSVDAGIVTNWPYERPAGKMEVRQKTYFGRKYCLALQNKDTKKYVTY